MAAWLQSEESGFAAHFGAEAMSEQTVFLGMVVLGVAFFSGLAVWAVRWVAQCKALLDRPNRRSSHELPVPRLGGAGFVPVVVITISALAVRSGSMPEALLAVFLGGAIVLFGVGLVDDFVSLSTGLRFALHFVVAGALLWMAVRFWPPLPSVGGGASLSPPSVWYWALVFWIVGLLNIYNFMDGIDGLAGMQAVVAGAAWGVAGATVGAPVVAVIGFGLGAGGLGFLVWNWPPAKIFMGDAGSTVLGYSFAGLPVLFTVEAGDPARFDEILLGGALVVWPFLADGGFTILRRLKNGENIFRAHRSHLYQRLVISGVSHRKVTVVYGLLAGGGVGLAWWVVTGRPYSSPASLALVGFAFSGLWRWVVSCEARATVVTPRR
jgi:UDP-N-acetylmuramyl pentapeptide phosphotransferase/UDP-N-acetylglucosamine-1-phosphate transferase